MINFNYQKQVVLSLYLRENSGTLDPSPNDLKEFDQELFDANDDILKEQMTAAGLNPNDNRAKSAVLLYSQDATGNSTSEQVRRACKFYDNTKGI